MTSALGVATGAPALQFDQLDVEYRVRDSDLPVLRGLTLSIMPGESYGLVGESGCGKSTAAFAALGYLPSSGRVAGGSIRIAGRSLLEMTRGEVRQLRARHVAIVYQDPGAALNPSIRVGDQVSESFVAAGVDKDSADKRAVDALTDMHISQPERVMGLYPHEISGGMQQRVVIAMALAKDPALLILDEPTTGLDATIEAEVLGLLRARQTESGMSVLLISHNLAVVAGVCDRVGVLYSGQLVEEGPARQVLQRPRHAYSAGLVRSVPRDGLDKYSGRLDAIPGFLPELGRLAQGCAFVDRCAIAQPACREEAPALAPPGAEHTSRCLYPERVDEIAPTDVSEAVPRPSFGTDPILRVRNVNKTYHRQGRSSQVLSDISLDLFPGETLGVVGESGSGKTTLGRIIVGLTEPDSGSEVRFEDKELAGRVSRRSAVDVRSIQMVFQNPESALNRRWSVGRILRRSLRQLSSIARDDQEQELYRLADAVRLDRRFLASRPVQLSGGLKQRVAIARAFAGDSRVIVCDEPTSALDVSVQAAILNLFTDLQAQRGVAYVFVSHDLEVVRYVADRIAVLYLGRLLEIGPSEEVFSKPHHPYTQMLLSASVAGGTQAEAEEVDASRSSASEVAASDAVAGCVFATRCPRSIPGLCDVEDPPVLDGANGHVMRCHLSLEELADG